MKHVSLTMINELIQQRMSRDLKFHSADDISCLDGNGLLIETSLC